MIESGLKATGSATADPDLAWGSNARRNLGPAELIEQALIRKEGKLTESGALAVDTGEFTGRSPKDRYIVKDDITSGRVWWEDQNIPFDPEKFDRLYDKVTAYLSGKEVFVQDVYACADPAYRINIRLVTEMAYQALFAHNLFLRPREDELLHHFPDWSILVATGYKADPRVDGTRRHNFVILHFKRRVVLIGGTGYTGEIKKSIFSVLNFLLPEQHGVLPMHCAANTGSKQDTAIFFGLSGTGKTTLSADPARSLIGDDEHGWTDKGIFNFEGGCYAKCINLSPDKEPQIYRAVRFGALLENTVFAKNSRVTDYADSSKTENTRVAYPLSHIANVVIPSSGRHPDHIFFLTADAFGVLPPVSRLTVEQAMYYFISGYTAKIAGTEAGINEPQATFSACFGKAFLPLHPGRYAGLLGDRLSAHRTRVWLVNTGWTGGAYGTGERIKLEYTRAMVSAVLNGELEQASFHKDRVFGLAVPENCPGVPAEMLNPRNTWVDKQEYDRKARELARAFRKNFKQFESGVSTAVLQCAPKIS